MNVYEQYQRLVGLVFDRFSIRLLMTMGFVAFLVIVIGVWQIGRAQLAAAGDDIAHSAVQAERISEIVAQVGGEARQAADSAHSLSEEMNNRLVKMLGTNAGDVRALEKAFERTVGNLKTLIDSGEEDAILLMLEVEDIYEKIRKEYLPLVRNMASEIENSAEVTKTQAQGAASLQSNAENFVSQAANATAITDDIQADSVVARQRAEAAMQFTLWVIAGAVFVLLVISFNTYLVISRPVLNLRDRIIDIAEGEGDLTRRIPVSANNEFGDLAVAFNRFLDRLSVLIGSVRDAGIRIGGAADEVQLVTEETRSGMHLQQGELSQMVTAINQMSVSINEIAQRATDAEQAAKGANDEAGAGRKEVETTIQSISSLAEEIDRTAEVVAVLKNDSLGIGGVLDVIKGIAEQTNLLALNAAIEAARAG
ncbi:MAG: methyl-accepting chemotaxis protein, partial [Gammaproteobacteria bacterium]|nr:methyl-accepting chemotaxis protein [Gammaproteobacteria bacterium]